MLERFCLFNFNFSNYLLQLLEDMIAAHNDDPDIYKVQPLGKHYALRWAQEDLLVRLVLVINMIYTENNLLEAQLCH